MSESRNDVTDSVPPTTRSPDALEFEEALHEVDAVISWSLDSGWSSTDVTRGLVSANDDDFDLDAEPFSSSAPYALFPGPSSPPRPSGVTGLVDLDDDETKPSAGCA
jgi:hypothetical protein